MRRYFFHDEDGAREIDRDGTTLPDDHAAMVEGARMLGEMLKDRAEHFWERSSLKLLVTDEAGRMLFVLALTAVTAPALDPQLGRLCSALGANDDDP